MNRLAVVTIGFLVSVLLCAFVIYPRADQAPTHVFVTEYGTGPDKWATAWYLSRYRYPDSSLKLVEEGQPMPEGIEFDTHSAQIRRSANQSAFETALALHEIEDSALDRLATAIHDIEVNYWAAPNTPDAPVIDHAFRTVHRDLADNPGHSECYISFFEETYQALKRSERLGEPLAMNDFAAECSPLEPDSPDNIHFVEELPINQVLEALAQDKRVTFIDVREPAEYREAHIPGAVNLTLRDVEPSAIQSLKDDDYVVAYCVKDFRGYEMAKLLKRHGVRNAVILNPFGIKGWIAEGLPVIGKNGLQQEQGEDWLRQCSADSSRCTAWTTATGSAPDV